MTHLALILLHKVFSTFVLSCTLWECDGILFQYLKDIDGDHFSHYVHGIDALYIEDTCQIKPPGDLVVEEV